MALLAASVYKLGATGHSMDANAVQVMELFLIERLQDYATQHEVLDAMRALVLHHKFPEKESAKKLAVAYVKIRFTHHFIFPPAATVFSPRGVAAF